MATRTRRSSDFAAMRNRIVGKKETQPENVIPMINIIFLLLLYFMIAGNLQPDFDVTPPVSAQEAEPAKHLPTLSITQDGTMRFENQPVDIEQLKVKLAGITGHERLKIHADAKVEALTVSKVMKLASEAGVTIFVLVTQKRAEGR